MWRIRRSPLRNVLSSCLTFFVGKAHEFYVQEVLGDLYWWHLSEFFKELFNYCFPMDFCIRLQKKLQSCYQNSKTVCNYTYKLIELWNMIGEGDKRACVHKFWFGLCKEIQHNLWRKKLNPEISSLKIVILAAEVIEIARSIIEGVNEWWAVQWNHTLAVQSMVATLVGHRVSCGHRRLL